MNEVPNDIMEAAKAALNSAVSAAMGGDPQPSVFIASAILAERERCAKIAETLGVYPELNVFGGGPSWYRHGKDIAAAIRQGQAKEGGGE